MIYLRGVGFDADDLIEFSQADESVVESSCRFWGEDGMQERHDVSLHLSHCEKPVGDCKSDVNTLDG